jgi:hypothetical protein
MPTRITFTFEGLASLLQTALRDAGNLSYVPDDSIVVQSPAHKDKVPQFKNYLIRIMPMDTGFIIKQPRIGQYYRNNYLVAIEIWIKTGVADRLNSGHVGVSKGLYEFFQDVSDTLEHNTFNDQLDPFAGTNIFNMTMILDPEERGQMEGIGFIWQGCQDNVK